MRLVLCCMAYSCRWLALRATMRRGRIPGVKASRSDADIPAWARAWVARGRRRPDQSFAPIAAFS